VTEHRISCHRKYRFVVRYCSAAVVSVQQELNFEISPTFHAALVEKILLEPLPLFTQASGETTLR